MRDRRWLASPGICIPILLIGLSCAAAKDAYGGQHKGQPKPSPSPAKQPAQNPLPPPTGHVNDYSHALNDETRDQIEQALAELEKRSKIQFAVVLVNTTGDKQIADYSKAVADGWNVGSGGDGILLLLAIDDHHWRIQTTRALVPDLPAEKIKEVSDLMNPSLAQQHYGDGIRRGVTAIIKILAAKRGFAPINIPAPLLPSD